jgi:hypothetical protein
VVGGRGFREGGREHFDEPQTTTDLRICIVSLFFPNGQREGKEKKYSKVATHGLSRGTISSFFRLPCVYRKKERKKGRPGLSERNEGTLDQQVSMTSQ